MLPDTATTLLLEQPETRQDLVTAAPDVPEALGNTAEAGQVDRTSIVPQTTLPSTTLPSTTLPSTTLPSTTLPSTTLPTAVTTLAPPVPSDSQRAREADESPEPLESDATTADLTRGGVPPAVNRDLWMYQAAAPQSKVSQGTEQSPGADRIDVDFNGQSSKAFGAVTQSTLESEFGVPFKYFYNGSQHLSLNSDGRGDTSLRQRYVPTQSGSDIVEFLNLPGSIDGSKEMWLSYQVYFEPGFEWVWGGKLPGLAGGSYVSGGSSRDDGFSARFMWRPNGKLVVYAYHQDRPSQWGEDLELCGTVATGEWIQITQRVVMNSAPDKRDGIVEAWINGEKRLQRTDLRWSTTQNLEVDVLAYSSFYGGNGPDWAPSKTTHIQFDDFKVSTSTAGIDWTVEGQTPSRSWVSC